MQSLIRTILFVTVLGITIIGLGKTNEPLWQQLPPTPHLPKAQTSGYAPINGVRIWYATFGQGPTVILLHGGLANSNYWGNQISALEKNYHVIVMDSRGHGRSSRDERAYSYSLMASDVIALMDYLKIKQATIVGWSDGAILGIDLALNHPNRINKVFAFAANSDPSGNGDTAHSKIFNDYLKRAANEYKMNSPTPTQFSQFLSQIKHMWETQPNFTKEQLNTIHVPMWIIDGDRDTSIKRENTEFMAAQIPNAGLLILPHVGHFAFLEDPEQFNDNLIHFLAHS